MKNRASMWIGVGAIVLVVAVVLWLRHDRAAPDGAPPAPASTAKAAPSRPSPAPPVTHAAAPGQARAIVEPSDVPGGMISGRVINWSRGDGVASAELTFTSDDGATTVRTHDDGGFELAPPAPG